MIINALKWLVNFLETRFPAKVTPVSQEEFQRSNVAYEKMLTKDSIAIDRLSTEIEKIQKQVEVLNLRVGLSRPIPYGLKEKQHG